MESKIRKIENTNPNTNGEKENKVSNREVSIEAQSQLVEILNDSPRVASLAGTEYEIRSLRFGTQYLIAQEVVNINKLEKNAKYGDVVKKFSENIPSLIKVITLCLLNSRDRIYKNGDKTQGFSEEYYSLYETLMWEGNINEYGELLLECLQMLDITDFCHALDILQIFRASITMRRTEEQK